MKVCVSKNCPFILEIRGIQHAVIYMQTARRLDVGPFTRTAPFFSPERKNYIQNIPVSVITSHSSWVFLPE
jgi:hypothetical protein